MLHKRKLWFILLAACTLLAGCQRTIVPKDQPQPGEKVYTGCIPQKAPGLAKFHIEAPQPIASKRDWVEDCTIRITTEENDVEQEVYRSSDVKIKGRGNSTWKAYPKKPYTFKLPEQANFIGTGKTKRWVLLANWMDRTLLRNDIAFEAARRTSIAWVPSGTHVELYLDGEYNGIYFLAERIHVEGSHFTCDYLLSFDISDKEEIDFQTLYGHWQQNQKDGGIPVEIKYPDRDNYTEAEFKSIVIAAKNKLHTIETAIMRGDAPSTVLDLDSICDWYLVQEFTGNAEPRFPKSTFFYIKDDKLYGGPVWDFDYGTFTEGHHTLALRSSLYFYHLFTHPEFIRHLKHRWSILRPRFMTLPEYVDERANFIRDAEQYNHVMWPCFPNPLSEEATGLVNQDEKLSFQEAVDRIKTVMVQRIKDMDGEINRL